MKIRANLIPISFFLLCALGVVVFYPGLAGPFIFDDEANILSNPYISIQKLDFSSIYLSAISGSAGPLGRPLPMASFALNHYFSGGFGHTFSFKFTNLTIHLINGFLVLFVFRLLLANSRKTYLSSNTCRMERKQVGYVSLILAAVWIVHPLQVTAVFYIVQRMATLSAMFVLLGLIAYLVVRTSDKIKYSTRILLLSSIPFSLLLGLLSKENSILLLPFILLIELSNFRDRAPWSTLKRWNPWITVVSIFFFTGLLILLAMYSLPGYTGRDFSLTQRLLTETRVLVLYLSLLFVPLLYKYGLFHDDIAISTGLLNPPTTLFSLLFLISVSIVAVVYRKKYPYLLFGWLWFLVAHSLESTFIPLEIAHEHRNYIALIGPLFACAGLINRAYHQLSRPIYLFIISVVIGAIAIVTYLRSEDWSSYQNLIVTESTYHPGSPRAQAALGSLLVGKHLLSAGLEAMTNAHNLKPGEAGFLLNMLIIDHMMDKKAPAEWRNSLILSYGGRPVSPLGMQVLDYAYGCTLDACKGISGFIGILARKCSRNLLNSASSRARCMYYDGLLTNRHGDRENAINKLRESARLDKDFIRPIIEIALVQLENSNYTGARTTIENLIERNARTRFKKTQEVNSVIYLFNRTIQLSRLAPLKPVVD